MTTKAQLRQIEEMKKLGYHVIIWDHDRVCMMDCNNNPAEVHNNGNVIYPDKRN